MALIDKETIRAEIERRTYNAHEMPDSRPDKQFYEGKDVAYGEILAFLDTIPEQPKLKPMNIPSGGGAMGTTPPSYKLDVKPRITNKLFEECLANVDPAIRKEVSDKIDKILGRQPVEGLMEEIEKRYEQAKWGYVDGFGATVMDKGQFIRIARHFAEWGAEHLKK